MYQEKVRRSVVDGYRSMAFSDRIHKLCSEAGRSTPATRRASFTEAVHALKRARTTLSGLVPDAMVERVMSHNPDVFQLIEGDGVPPGASPFLAFLPLNPEGARALVAGGFNGKDPDLNLVCRRGEVPAAIYVWLIYAPSAFTPTIRALASFFGNLAPGGCPLFTRAVTRHTARLFPAMGFVTAQLVYPSLPADVLCLPPISGFPSFGRGTAKQADTITVRIARTIDDVFKAFTIRSATYISEQECPYAEEFDGNDFCATHLIGEINGEPAGCIRVRFFSDFVKLERLAVRHQYRNSRLAFRLVRDAIGYCRRKGYRRAYGHSRLDLTRFWGLFGFKPLADRAPFAFSDVEYVELQANLECDDDAIAIGDDPYVLIRPEGDWDRPGPLDRSVARFAFEPGVVDQGAPKSQMAPQAPSMPLQ